MMFSEYLTKGDHCPTLCVFAHADRQTTGSLMPQEAIRWNGRVRKCEIASTAQKQAFSATMIGKIEAIGLPISPALN